MFIEDREISLNSDISLSRGVSLLRKGEVTKGIQVLESVCANEPGNFEAFGHLAWALFSQKRWDEARKIYKHLQKTLPGNNEPSIRLIQIDLEQSGYSHKHFNEMLHYTRKSALNEPLWRTLIEIDEKHNKGRRIPSLCKEALRYFPHNSFYIRFSIEKKSMLRKIAKLLGGRKLAQLLIGIPIVREKMLQTFHSQEEAIRSAIASAFVKGSANATFPYSPPEMSPENFDKYIKESEVSWWKWTKENTPVKDAKGHQLLDIGAGPGFIGHHFKFLGYEVTAVSGNDAELNECSRRGMKTIKCEMHSLPVPSKSYDAVLACHVLEHSIVPYVLLLEIKRVLKSDGLLFVNVPYPIEGDPALDFPECYDVEKDEYQFEIDKNTGHVVNQRLAYYSYGVTNHIFVLTYWQWRWLFRLAGFKHYASAIDVFPEGKLLSPDHIADMEEYKHILKNQLFILRRE